jgi:hypothetical protein
MPMHIVITDLGVGSEALLERLTGCTRGVTVVKLAPGDNLADLRSLEALQPGSPLLLVTRLPLPEPARLARPGVAVMFPEDLPGPANGSRRMAAPLLPGTVLGPLSGHPGRVERKMAEVLRCGGIAASCRPDMQEWLRVTSVWLAPLRGAVIAAAHQGCAITEAQDLVTIATRAARERLLLMRTCGFRVDARCALLLAVPESWAIRAMARVARALPDEGNPLYLPTAAEAAAVSREMATEAYRLGLRTPAADFLDQFSAEAERGSRCENGSSAHSECGGQSWTANGAPAGILAQDRQGQ